MGAGGGGWRHWHRRFRSRRDGGKGRTGCVRDGSVDYCSRSQGCPRAGVCGGGDARAAGRPERSQAFHPYLSAVDDWQASGGGGVGDSVRWHAMGPASLGRVVTCHSGGGAHSPSAAAAVVAGRPKALGGEKASMYRQYMYSICSRQGGRGLRRRWPRSCGRVAGCRPPPPPPSAASIHPRCGEAGGAHYVLYSTLAQCMQAGRAWPSAPSPSGVQQADDRPPTATSATPSSWPRASWRPHGADRYQNANLYEILIQYRHLFRMFYILSFYFR